MVIFVVEGSYEFDSRMYTEGFINAFWDLYVNDSLHKNISCSINVKESSYEFIRFINIFLMHTGVFPVLNV